MQMVAIKDSLLSITFKPLNHETNP